MARLIHLAAALTVAGLAVVQGAQSPGDLSLFLSWFSQQTGVATNVSLSHFSGMGIGLVANGTTYDGLPVLHVPLSAVICDSTMMGSTSGRVLDVLSSTADAEERIVLFLMRQLALGSSSTWHPYIQVLPAHVPATVWWDDASLASLGDAAVVATSTARRDKVKMRFAASVSALHVMTEADPSVATLENWLWAHTIVTSRALTLHGRKYLVPFADFFNYHPHANLRKSNLGNHFLQYHTVSDSHFTVIADRGAPPGQQLSEDYGDNGNDVYLQYHGFVPAENPFACWQFPLPSSAALRKRGHGERKNSLLKALMQREQMAWSDMCLIPGRPVPPVVYNVLHLQRASGPQLAKCRDFMSNTRSPSAYTKCFGAQPGTPKAMAGVVKVLTKALGRLPGTTAGDEASVAALAGPAQDAEAAAMAMTPGQQSISEQHSALQAFLAARYRLSIRHTLQGIIDDLSALLPADPDDSPAMDAATRRAARAAHLDETTGISATITSTGEVVPEVAAEEGEFSFSPRSEVLPSSPGATVPAGAPVEQQEVALEVLVSDFNAWFAAFSPPVAAIEAAVVGAGMRLGVVATRDIAAEEVYLSVPNAAIMSSASAAASPALAPVFADLAKRFPRGDAYHQLLFHLMYETFVAGVGSAWAPYLATLPTSVQMGFPLFYSDAQLAELAGTQVLGSITSNRDSILRKFKGIQGAVFQVYPEVFDPNVFTFHNYLWATAILDSRSIWWGGQRHLVPLLDLINCAEGPSPQRVHSTVSDAAGENALTRAGWAFPAGSQLWENYGQPNSIYFSYHGFTLEPNSHDCADFAVDVALVDPAAVARVQARQWPATISACVAPVGEGVPMADSSNKFGVPDRIMSYAVDAFDTDEAGAIEALVQLASMQLRKFPTTIEEDEALLAGEGAGSTFIDVNSSIVRFRLSQKQLLSRWLASVKTA